MAADLDAIWTPSWWPLFGNNHCTGAFGCLEMIKGDRTIPWARTDSLDDAYSLEETIHKYGKSRSLNDMLGICAESRI